MANVPITGAGPMIGLWLAAYDMGSDGSTEEAGPFDAASVDIYTTCIDRTERISQLRARHPSLQHIVMSGLESEADAMRGLHELRTLFLAKPFRLANAVERRLAT